MNYYPHHIGDYLSATAHLSLLEHGAYRRLIDVYYINEALLPADLKQVYRLVGARSKEEREAVDTILGEFFKLEPGGYRQPRCDREIALCEKNRTNGKKGGRPPKNDNPDGTQKKPKPNPEDNPDGTQNEPKPKAPITHYPLPIKPSSESESIPRSVDPTPAGIVCSRLRQAGIASVNPSHPKLIGLLAAGLTPDEIAAVGDEVQGQGKGFAWVLATAEGRRRDAAAIEAFPQARASPSNLGESREQASKFLTGRGKSSGSERDITEQIVRLA